MTIYSNMENDKTTRIYYTDEHNCDLFFIELVHDPIVDFYFVKSSLNYNLFAHENIKHVMEMCTDPEIRHEKRLALLEDLVQAIRIIPGIENYYFDQIFLSKEGKYQECYMKTLYDIANNMAFPDFTPFSNHVNAVMFQVVVENLRNRDSTDCLILNRNEFEKIVNSSATLMDEYLKVFDLSTKYYLHSFEEGGRVFDFYVLTNNAKITFIVVKERVSNNIS
jgi:hypothetical protein